MSKETAYGDSLEPRIFGGETEYGVTDRVYGTVIKPTWPDYQPHLNEYDTCGGRLYLDIENPEYATPECFGLDEIVLYEMAGDEFTQNAIDVKYPGVRLHKRCVSPGDYKLTTGYHENYATEIDIWNEKAECFYNRHALLSHLATRLQLIGSGTTANEEYTIAQKVHGLQVATHRDTVNNKPLLNLRNEPHTGGVPSPLNRLHITSGDPNISPQASRLKFGSTSCVLRLLEQGENVGDLFLEDPLEVAYMAGGPIASANQPVRLQNGAKATPLEIQRAWASRAKKLHQKTPLPTDESEALDLWIETIDAVQHYYETGNVKESLEQLDWFTKYEYTMKYANKPPAQVDLAYDKLREGIGYKLRENGRFAPYAPKEQTIESAKNSQPSSRAQLRGAFVMAAYNHLHNDTLPFTNASVDWNQFTHKGRRYRLGRVSRTYAQEEIDTALHQVGLDQTL